MPAPRLATTAQIGSYGERVARALLIRRGYKILTANFETSEGEIDLVCRLGELLVFVEVKTRVNIHFGRPAEAIDARKEEALRTAARRYLAMLDNDEIRYRFDAVEVLLRAGEIPDCTLVPDVLV